MVETWERTDLKSSGGKKGPGSAEAKSLLRCVLQHSSNAPLGGCLWSQAVMHLVHLKPCS